MNLDNQYPIVASLLHSQSFFGSPDSLVVIAHPRGGYQVAQVVDLDALTPAARIEYDACCAQSASYVAFHATSPEEEDHYSPRFPTVELAIAFAYLPDDTNDAMELHDIFCTEWALPTLTTSTDFDARR